MLTEKEAGKIFSWLPYRDDWPDEGTYHDIDKYFEPVISEIKNNENFYAFQSQDGGNSNYLEFICYLPGDTEGNAIIAVYGQSTFAKEIGCFGHTPLGPEMVGVIRDSSLRKIGEEVAGILKAANIVIADQEFTNRELPAEVLEDPGIEGDLYFHGLFQWSD